GGAQRRALHARRAGDALGRREGVGHRPRALGPRAARPVRDAPPEPRAVRAARVLALPVQRARVPAGVAHVPHAPGARHRRQGPRAARALSRAVTIWRIDRPFIKGASTGYERVRFVASDRVTVRAGGCVRRGGLQNPAYRYVDSGENLYYGLIDIPGVTPVG